jgi:hypothetical protein
MESESKLEEKEILIFKNTENFLSKISYLDKEGREQKVTVVVEVNYITKTFDIKNSNNGYNFIFQKNSHQSNIWLATLKAIENGINHAKKLLENEN